MRNSIFIKICVFFFLSFTSLLSLGQNYQVVNSGRTALFYDSAYKVYGLRMDSVKNIDGDSIYYPVKLFQSISNGDISFSLNGSWVGKSILSDNQGDLFIINKNMDSILVKSQDHLHDQWTSFYIEDSLSVISEIIATDTMTFLGLTDSVKYISFTCYDRNMNLIECILNNLQIIISKNYGFVKTINFYHFPGLNVDNWLNKPVIEISLAGLTNPNIGIKNLDWRDIYNINIGDEIHWKSFVDDCDAPCAIERKFIDIYIDRHDFEDSIVYTINRHEICTKWGESFCSGFEDTIYTGYIKYSATNQFSYLPNEPIINGNKGSFWSMSKNFVFVKKKSGYCENLELDAGTDYWYQEYSNNPCSSYYYYQGIGGPFYTLSLSNLDVEECSEYEVKLIYCRKGDLEWGTPYNFAESVLQSEIREIFVFPNPAQEKTTVKIADNLINECIFSITDIAGRRLLSVQLNSESNEINIENLSSGIYLYNIVSKYGVIKSGKLIIE